MSTTDSQRPFPVVRILLWVLLAVAGVGLWLLSLRGPDLPRAWRALLVTFLFFTSLGGGLVVWPAAVRACNGRWHTGIERLAASGIAFALPSLAALVVLWIGSPAWSPWYQMRYHQGLWLDNAFLFGRDLAALAIFWSVALVYLLRRREGEARYCGPILVLVYSVVFSLLGFDLVMSLDPLWKSNLAGGYFFITALYIAMICWGLLASLHPDTGPDQRQDLGKLVYAFAMMTIYLMYAHLNLMYYENLPHEVRFLIPRMHNSSWKSVSYLVLFLPYFGPLLMLLGIKVKRNRWTLGCVCVLLLVGMWVERWWLVAPTFETRVSLGLSEVSMAACCLGLLGLGMELFHRWIPRSYLQGEQQK
jgi:heme/copper-type cytochrome/quinol oxidase subunit 4